MTASHSSSPSFDFDEVSVENVSRHFGRRKALSRISFRARHGSILGLLGPNGAGKSTMLSLLATLMRPSSGRILFGTRDVADDQRRIADQRLCDSESLAHPTGKGLDATRCRAREIHRLEHRADRRTAGA